LGQIGMRLAPLIDVVQGRVEQDRRRRLGGDEAKRLCGNAGRLVPRGHHEHARLVEAVCLYGWRTVARPRRWGRRTTRAGGSDQHEVREDGKPFEHSTLLEPATAGCPGHAITAL